jgi:molecular chaperone DnaK (HSP70)
MAVAVGIDLGSTNSVIAATEARKPAVIRRHHADGGLRASQLGIRGATFGGARSTARRARATARSARRPST